MRYLMVIILLLMSQASLAVQTYDHGFYGSLTVGRGYNHFSRDLISNKDTGGEGDWIFSGRLALGFNIDQYIGVELGDRYFMQREFKNLQAQDIAGKVDETAYDLQTIIRWPFMKGYNLIAKFGPAFVDARQSISGENSDTILPGNKHIQSWLPTYGFGLSVDLDDYPGVSFVLDYSTIIADNDKQLPASQIYTAGLIFHF
jgi:hypothetical protein